MKSAYLQSSSKAFHDGEREPKRDCQFLMSLLSGILRTNDCSSLAFLKVTMPEIDIDKPISNIL